MTPPRLSIALFAVVLVAPWAAAADGPDLRWLAGAWCGGEGDEAIEETWLAPAGGELVGMSRTLDKGRHAFHEFMRIAPVDGVTTFFAQPNGKPPTAFPAVEFGEGRIRFANDHHDFPQWIEYRRDGEKLLAEIGGPGADGRQVRVPFRYERCAPTAD